MFPNSNINGWTLSTVVLYLPILTFRVPEVVSAEFKLFYFRHAESQDRRLKICQILDRKHKIGLRK